MNYIVFDLEFNQDFSPAGKQRIRFFEIIQIGAVKLDEGFNIIGTFRRNVKPCVYPLIDPFITELTGITTEQLACENTFPSVFEAFAAFSGGSDSVFCIWGIADLKELFRNMEYHKLDRRLMISRRYFNLQPSVSMHFGRTTKKMLNLKTAAELFGIPLAYSFHDALHDALYTAEILKRINRSTIRPKRYDPEKVPPHAGGARAIQNKPKVDFEKLTRQFEKMYGRELTEEERRMIILAYKMGKTRQFLK